MGGDGDTVWFHRSIAGTVQAAGSGDGDEAEEGKAFLVPSATSFPHGMSVAARGPVAGCGQERGVQQVAVQLAGLVRRHGRWLVGCPVAEAAPRAEQHPGTGGGHGARRRAHHLRRHCRSLQPRRHQLLPHVAGRDGLPRGAHTDAPRGCLFRGGAHVMLRVVRMWPSRDLVIRFNSCGTGGMWPS
jgi:hypothetical protein